MVGSLGFEISKGGEHPTLVIKGGDALSLDCGSFTPLKDRITPERSDTH